jgi:hypothetical protein
VTDPPARLHLKGAGQPPKLCDLGHLLMENRSGLIVAAELTPGRTDPGDWLGRTDPGPN